MAKKDSTGCGGITVILVLAFVGAKLIGLSPLAFVSGLITNEPFGCEQNQSAAIAHAAGDCPEALKGAATDPGWAADRIADIGDKSRTTGLFYDADGTELTYESGGKDDDARVARDIGRQREIFPKTGTVVTVKHVEVKVAAAMYQNNIAAGVLVINHPGGPCGRDLGGRYSCVNVVEKLLPDGASLIVWWPDQQSEKPQRTEFTGGQS